MVKNNHSREAVPIKMDLEKIEDDDNGSRFHIVSGITEGGRLVETSDVLVLQKWIRDLKSPKFLGFSVKPPQDSDQIARIFLADKASTIIFRVMGPVLPLIVLPLVLVDLLKNQEIKFFSYSLNKKKVRNRFNVQFGLNLGSNFVFLNRYDHHLNWNADNIKKSCEVVKQMKESISSCSSQWNSSYLPYNFLQYSLSELHLAREAGQIC